MIKLTDDKRFIWIIVFVTILLLGLFVVFFQFVIGWDFQNNLWAPAHLLLQNKSPYNIHVFIDHANAVWLPFAITVFLPLGVLPIQQANNFWVLVNLFSFFILIWVLLKDHSFGMKGFFLTVFVLILFPPILTNFLLGQISLLIVLIYTGIALYWEKIPVWGLGFLIAITLSKPQLAIFFLPAFFIIVWQQAGFRKAVMVAGMSVLWCIVLLLPFFLLYPGWIPDFLFNLRTNKDWVHPNLPMLLYSIFSMNRMFFILPFILLGEILSILGVFRLKPKTALFWSIALTTVFSPYIWTWDFVLFIPLVVDTVLSQNCDKTVRGYLLFGFLFLNAMMIGLKIAGQVNENLYWWFPLVTLFLAVLPTVLPNHTAEQVTDS